MGPLHITKVEYEREKGSNESSHFPSTPDNNNVGNGLEGKHALTKSSFSREIIKVPRTGIFYHYLTASAFAKRI